MWVPVKLTSSSQHSGKAKQQMPTGTYNLGVDSGASCYFFLLWSYVVDYKDITNAGHYIVVASDTQIPIHGIGTVRCQQMDGHEVLLHPQITIILHPYPSSKGDWLLSCRRRHRMSEVAVSLV
jgi:hypothetical protein